jgi:hypothetical protein
VNRTLGVFVGGRMLLGMGFGACCALARACAVCRTDAAPAARAGVFPTTDSETLQFKQKLFQNLTDIFGLVRAAAITRPRH